MELLTHTELSQKLKDGWTSVILVTGGTEERGPQDVLGGHTMMAHSHATMIAKKLGKTLVAPVLPIAVNATGLNANREMADQAGAMQMPAEVFKQVQLAEIDSLARSGFKDIYVMGDHGGGQAEMKDAAEEMDKKWIGQGHARLLRQRLLQQDARRRGHVPLRAQAADRRPRRDARNVDHAVSRAVAGRLGASDLQDDAVRSDRPDAGAVEGGA